MTTDQRTEKPTLVSLARELGVSRQTVSNVINSPGIVRPETRERVLAAIQASGYRPSAVGRALRTRRSMTLALRLYPASDGINGAVMDRFLHSLTVEAQRHGYRLTLFNADSPSDEVATLDELWQASTIDAAILTDTTVDDPRPAALQQLGLPFVAFGRPWGAGGATHHWFDIDGSGGTEQATGYLRQLGHTRIGFLGWPEGSGVGDDRRAGWHRGMGDLPHADLSVAVNDGPQAGALGAGELFARGATALVCSSDSLALGAAGIYRQDPNLREQSVPIVGFDDTPVAAAVGLCSVRQPVETVAAQAVATVLGLLRGNPPAQTNPLITPELVIRSVESFAR